MDQGARTETQGVTAPEGTVPDAAPESDIVDRLRLAHGVASDAALARVLGVDKSTVSGWRSRGSARPLEFCRQAAEGLGISMDWLVLGEGEMYRPGQAIPRLMSKLLQTRGDDPLLPEFLRFCKWLLDTWVTASPQDQDWILGQLRRNIPDWPDSRMTATPGPVSRGADDVAGERD